MALREEGPARNQKDGIQRRPWIFFFFRPWILSQQFLSTSLVPGTAFSARGECRLEMITQRLSLSKFTL